VNCSICVCTQHKGSKLKKLSPHRNLKTARTTATAAYQHKKCTKRSRIVMIAVAEKKLEKFSGEQDHDLLSTSLEGNQRLGLAPCGPFMFARCGSADSSDAGHCTGQLTMYWEKERAASLEPLRRIAVVQFFYTCNQLLCREEVW